MFNSPYAKGGMQTNGPAKPEYASGGDLNQNPGGMQQGGMQKPEGFIQQQNPWTATTWMNRPPDSQGGWNPNGFNGFIGAGSNAPYNGPIGGGFSQNKGPEMPPTVNPGQPGQGVAPNPSVPAGPTMPQFVMGGANNPAVNLNGRDNPRRFMQRPSLSPQQMQQLTRPNRPPQSQFPATDKPDYQSPPIIPPYPEY